MQLKLLFGVIFIFCFVENVKSDELEKEIFDLVYEVVKKYTEDSYPLQRAKILQGAATFPPLLFLS
uniref:Uncharacterized protein n=1 Tax=Meloidogyne enterolobii TaxID=390850 RepID=A0A6V7V3R5_MELEN|nr:unnamed protein product [Meloidogyne enterolobii]